MNNPNLYAVLLGGKIRKSNLMEDHHLVFVVAENEEEARKLSKEKWDAESIHVDGTQKLNIVDGYQIKLEKTAKEGEDIQLNPEYTKQKNEYMNQIMSHMATFVVELQVSSSDLERALEILNEIEKKQLIIKEALNPFFSKTSGKGKFQISKLKTIQVGQISIVYGIIKLNHIESFNNVVKAMPADDNYPWIRAEMFNSGSTQAPYFYKSTIATFGATYKNLEDETSLSEFLQKFENILGKLDFDFARIRLETEFRGDFELFWGRKTGKQPEFYDNKGLSEHEFWFFGYGLRNMFGNLIQNRGVSQP